MSIADKLTLLAASKEIVRLKLGISEDVPFSEYGDHIGWDGITSDLGQSTTTAASQKLVTDEVGKTKDREVLLQTSITAILGINNKLTNRINALEESNISSLFNNGANNGIWLDPSDLKTMFQTVGGASLPVTKDGDPVGLILDKSQGLEGAVTNVAKPFIADRNDAILDITNTSDGTKIVYKGLAGAALIIFEVDKTYSLSVVYSIPESSNDIPVYNTGGGVSNFLFAATKGVRNRAEVTLTAKNTPLYFRAGSGEITIHEVVLKEIKGNHASQPLAASRPTYRTDGVLHWLAFDGVDDGLDVNITATNNFDLSLSFDYLDWPTGARGLITHSSGNTFIFGSAGNGNFNLFNTADGRLEDTDRRNQGIKVITAYLSTTESNYIGQSGNLNDLPTRLTKTVNSLKIGNTTIFDIYGLIFKDSSQFYADRSKQLHSYMQRKAGV